MTIIVTSGLSGTGQTIINRALRLLGQLESGQSATPNETADALTSLNAIIDSWRNERLMCFAMQDEAIPLVSGNANRLIGPSGDYVTTRPVQIEAAYVIYSATSIPVRIVNEEEYAAIPDKTATSTYPERIYYQPSMANGTIYLHPVPNASSSLHIITRTPFTVFTSATDAIGLPPGWEEAFATNLAISIAPEYETRPSPEVVKAAIDSKANIKRVNSRPIKMTTELPFLVGHRRVRNIITDS